MRRARRATRHTRIILRHIVPNIVAPYLIMVTAFMAQAILLEASLSFLGLGVTEPTAGLGPDAVGQRAPTSTRRRRG